MKDLTKDERELLLSLRLTPEEKDIANQMGVDHGDLIRQKFKDLKADLAGRLSALEFDMKFGKEMNRWQR